MDTSDKQPGESWRRYWARKHDERHGPACDCLGNPGQVGGRMPLPGAVSLDTVPEGMRVELWRG